MGLHSEYPPGVVVLIVNLAEKKAMRNFASKSCMDA